MRIIGRQSDQNFPHIILGEVHSDPCFEGSSFRVFDTGIGASYKVQPKWIEKYVSGGVWEDLP